MPEWTVNWTGTYETDTPMQAAVEAWEAMQRVGSIANVFDVSDKVGMTVRVDLDDEVGTAVGPSKWVPTRRQIALLAEWMHEEQWDITEIVTMIHQPWKYADEYSKMLVELEFAKVAKEPEVDEDDD
jgi:hypothetical protein